MGGPCEHIAADFDSVCGDADADGIYAGVNHGLKVPAGLDPVCHCRLGRSVQSRPCEHRQIASESMWVTIGQNRFTFQSVFVRGMHPHRVVLRRIHEGLVDR